MEWKTSWWEKAMTGFVDTAGKLCSGNGAGDTDIVFSIVSVQVILNWNFCDTKGIKSSNSHTRFPLWTQGSINSLICINKSLNFEISAFKRALKPTWHSLVYEQSISSSDILKKKILKDKKGQNKTCKFDSLAHKRQSDAGFVALRAESSCQGSIWISQEALHN